MKKLFSVFMVFGTCLLLAIATSNPAEAKRLGGGGSFGSKFSQSKSVKRTSDQQTQRQPSAATQQNSQMKQQMASKGGLMGILGGLAIGGLLGALFFGGAFENINFFDIIIFAAIAFILFKLLGSWGRGRQPATANGPSINEFSNEMPEQQSNKSATPPQAESDHSFGGMTLDDLRSEISREFDKEGFLDGAKSCYARLQKAWDENDLADLRQFTTDHVFAELQEQLGNRKQATDTKILALNAELISSRQLGEAMEATVLFEARLIEDGEESNVSEVWHFVRPAGALTPTWHLDGIQQVEE